MKTLGLLGGMSWESTALYYRWINEGVRDALGPLRSAEMLIHSYDFERIKKLQYADRWSEAGEILADRARLLEDAGAEAIIICTNTMHKVAGTVEDAVNIPLIHLADCTAHAIVETALTRVSLLGTRFTMEEDFYKDRLIANGLDVRIPNPAEIDDINEIIYQELCQGIVTPRSRERYRSIVARMEADGAQAVILGCTEITMLVGPEDFAIPTFDTTAIHAHAAVAFSIQDEQAQP